MQAHMHSIGIIIFRCLHTVIILLCLCKYLARVDRLPTIITELHVRVQLAVQTVTRMIIWFDRVVC